MRATRLTAILTALLLVASAAAVPAAVSATSNLTVDVAQAGDGDATVTVDSADGLVAGATVSVAPADANDTYAGSGEYVTDANGTVALPAPDADVTVTVEATDGNASAASTVLLAAPGLDVGVAQSADASATVTVTSAIDGSAADGATVNVSTVDENATYGGTGQYTTDANGTVTLPAPAETVDVSVEAADGELTGATTATLQNQSAVLGEDAENFGQMVSRFVHLLSGSDDHVPWIGRTVADFVTEHNPGKAPDHAGPQAGTAPPDRDDGDHGTAVRQDDDEHENEHERGPGDRADRDDGDRGPPAHADGNGKAKGHGR